MLTTKGENLLICQQKAYAFKLTWDEFREHQNADRLNKPHFVNDDIWESVQDTMSSYCNIFIAIEYKEMDPLFCSNAEIKEIIDIIANRRRCSTEQSLNDIRSALFGIGREHSWEDGQTMQLFEIPLVDTRNPASMPIKEPEAPPALDIPINISFTITEKRKAEEPNKDAKKSKHWDWIADNIEPSNFVIVIAKNNNKYALSLPNLASKIYVIEVKLYNKKTGVLSGMFHYNKDLDVTKSFSDTANDKVTIDQRSVLSIYTVEIDEDFKLTKANIREIEKYARLS